MKNTINKGTISLLIYKSGNHFVGICKEFGFVEEAETSEQVKDKLLNSSILLLKTVKENPRLEPSLNVKPSFKYRCLFNFIPIIFAFYSVFKKFRGSMQLDTYSLGSLANA